MSEQETLLVDYIKESIKNREEIPMTINERSLQIFGNEKYLSSKEGKKMMNNVLRKYHLNKSVMNMYKTKESFVFVRISNNKDALIVENKDTYTSIKNTLLKGEKILGKEFGAVIYGEGRKIQSSFSYIEKEEGKELADIETFYYFGDIDAEGIDIFNRLKKGYPAYKIRAFKEGYRFLFDNRIKMRKKEKKKTQRLLYTDIECLECFDPIEEYEIYKICENGYIIPQEILNAKEITSA